MHNIAIFCKKVFAMIETREAIENLDSILDLEVLAYYLPTTYLPTYLPT